MEIKTNWSRARFPSSGLREEFLEQIRLWNRIEDLPPIQSRATGHYAELDFACADYRRMGLRKLVESYGGKLLRQPCGESEPDAPQSQAVFDAA